MLHALIGAVGAPALLVAVTVGFFLVLRRRSRGAATREERLRGLAAELGLRYYGRAGEEALDVLPDFSLAEKGYERGAANLMADGRLPPRLLLFDYGCTHAWGDAADRRSEWDVPVLHLVAMAAVPDGACPVSVRVYRTDLFGGPVGVRGAYRVEDDGDSGFGPGCLLVGEPREEAARMLGPAAREAVMRWPLRGPRPVVELQPGWAVAHVETDAHDRHVARRASALLTYVSTIAQHLGTRPAVTGDQ